MLVPLLLIFLVGCNTDRIDALEKQNKDLAAKLEAQTNTASLASQKECATQAESAFASGGWGKEKMASFTNHYNSKMNKCFVEVQNTDAKGATKDGAGILVSREVFDAFEGKEFGNYAWSSRAGKKYWEVAPFMCYVLSSSGEKVTCHSSDEFDALVKIYMED